MIFNSARVCRRIKYCASISFWTVFTPFIPRNEKLPLYLNSLKINVFKKSSTVQYSDLPVDAKIIIN